MKKFMSILFVSALGGGLTLSAYKLFFETSKPYEIVESRALTTTTVSGSNSLNSIEETVSFTFAAEKTLPTVVHVKNTTISKGYTSYEDLFFGRSQQRAQIGTGSGVIISSDGYIITNNHSSTALLTPCNVNTSAPAPKDDATRSRLRPLRPHFL